jgi:transposase
MSAVMVLPGPERRRRWTSTEKARIVEESLAAEASVAEVARRHDIHPNLLHQWRRQTRLAGAAVPRRKSEVPAGGVEFAPVAITADERIVAAPTGTIEIEFAGRARLKLTRAVDDQGAGADRAPAMIPVPSGYGCSWLSNATRNCPLCVMKNCPHPRVHDLG